MDVEKLKADHPALYAQVMDLGQAKVQAKMDTALAQAETDKTEAVNAARASTISMVDVVLGKESREKLDKVLASGMTPEQVKVSMDLFGKPAPAAAATGDSGQTPGSASRQQILDTIAGATPNPAPAAVDPTGTPDPAAEFLAKVDAHQSASNCKRSVAIETVAAGNPELYQGWLKAQQKK